MNGPDFKITHNITIIAPREVARDVKEELKDWYSSPSYDSYGFKSSYYEEKIGDVLGREKWAIYFRTRSKEAPNLTAVDAIARGFDDLNLKYVADYEFTDNQSKYQFRLSAEYQDGKLINHRYEVLPVEQKYTAYDNDYEEDEEDEEDERLIDEY